MEDCGMLPTVSRCDFTMGKRYNVKSIIAFDEDGDTLVVLNGPFHSRYAALEALRTHYGEKRKTVRRDYKEKSGRAHKTKPIPKKGGNANRLFAVLKKRNKR